MENKGYEYCVKCIDEPATPKYVNGDVYNTR